MESSLLGAVRATAVLLSAPPTRDVGEASTRNHRLDLERVGGKRGKEDGGKEKKEGEKSENIKGGQRERVTLNSADEVL